MRIALIFAALVASTLAASAQQRQQFQSAYDAMIGQGGLMGQGLPDSSSGRSYYVEQQSNMADRTNVDAGVNPRGNVDVNPPGFADVNPFGNTSASDP